MLTIVYHGTDLDSAKHILSEGFHFSSCEDPFLGKELTLLAWAIEDADPALTASAVANWQGLSPEERWWLYTMTAAATGHHSIGRNRGWRKAVRFALTENPVTHRVSDKPVVPEFFRLVSENVGSDQTLPIRRPAYLLEKPELEYAVGKPVKPLTRRESAP